MLQCSWPIPGFTSTELHVLTCSDYEELSSAGEELEEEEEFSEEGDSSSSDEPDSDPDNDCVHELGKLAAADASVSGAR